MNIGKYLICLSLLSFPVFAMKQENPVHPIDAALNKCLRSVGGTMPRAKCYSNASESWEKAVKDDYPKLLKQLSPEMQTILKEEQSAWEKYAEKYYSFVMAKYGKRRGSGYISVRIVLLMKPDKDRALELEGRMEQ